MKKIKLLGYFILFFGLFFVSGSGFISAFSYITEPHTLTDFSDGSSTFGPVTFPAGGGTLCDTYPPADANCPTVTLPCDAVVTSAMVTISETGTPIGTPYIWIPATTQHKLIQLKTSDGSLVHVFKQGADNCTASDFRYPSRITVMPGGDVWVGNRAFSNNVTRLGKKDGCVGDNCYECKGTYPTCGAASKGITFDLEGNIWAGSHASSCLVRLCGRDNCADVNGNTGYSIGDKMQINSGGGKQIGGASAYGLIGDSYGNIWGVNGSTKRVNINDDSATLYSTATGNTYGIGIDNTGDIWVGRHGSTGIWEIDGADDGGAGVGVIEPAAQCPTTFTNTGLAVDGNNNVWSTGYSGNSIYVIKEGDCSQTFSKSAVCTWNRSHGIAVDFDNHAWLICDTGEAVKYAFHDDGDATKADDGEDDIEELLRINLCTLPGVGCSNEGGATYNYSDMTGLRTVPKSMSVSTGTVPGVTSGSDTIFTGPAFVAALNNALLVGGSGYCEIPLKIYSMTAGDYTLKDLEIKYNIQVPVTTGGLVPCGREYDDLATTGWVESDDCTLCHLILMTQLVIEFLIKISAVVAAFFLAIAGFMYIFAAGKPEKITLAKQIFTRALFGFLIILISWIIIDTLLATFGYIDPLGDGTWHIMC